MAPNPNQRPTGKQKKRTHPANPFILFYQDMYKKYGGNMYATAKMCAQQWKLLPQANKDFYKQKHLVNLAAYKRAKWVQTPSTENQKGPLVTVQQQRPTTTTTVQAAQVPVLQGQTQPVQGQGQPLLASRVQQATPPVQAPQAHAKPAQQAPPPAQAPTSQSPPQNQKP